MVLLQLSPVSTTLQSVSSLPSPSRHRPSPGSAIGSTLAFLTPQPRGIITRSKLQFAKDHSEFLSCLD
jgi:hypothetical protein